MCTCYGECGCSFLGREEACCLISEINIVGSVYTAATSTVCACCGASHFVSACPVYKAKSPEQRRDFVTAKRLCYNCLGSHPVVRCTSVKRCLVCRQAHHTTIHVRPSGTAAFGEGTSNLRSSTSTLPSSSPSNLSPAAFPFNPTHANHQNIVAGSSASINHALPRTGPSAVPRQTLLPTALINVLSSEGRRVTSRDLLDQGSELSFVNENVVQRLQLPRRHSEITLFGIGATKQLTTRGVVQLRFQSTSTPTSEYVIEAHVLPKLTRRIPSHPVPNDDLPHLSNLNFADPTFATPGPIEILLGVNVFGHLLKEKIRRYRIDMPVGELTTLGWIVSGPVSNLSSGAAARTQSFFCNTTCDLNEHVHQFWEQEAVCMPDHAKSSKEDTLCENHFLSTCTRGTDGRYTVRLPFKTKPTHFGDIRNTAERMLASAHRRFQRNAVFRQLYVEFLDEYERLGHMQLFEDQQQEDSFYLPHHGVLRKSSLTTKLRVVFNGSPATSSGFTLNECLHAGPKLQDLLDMILRWRLFEYVFSADVEKMYRQILVHRDDRKYQKILWNPDPLKKPGVYELTTVTYGASCAPYLAIRTLLQLASDEESNFPLGADVIRHNAYVDDFFSGADTVADAQDKAKQVDQLLLSGGFCLKKWASNNKAVLSHIDTDRQLRLPKILDDAPILRVLGLSWDPLNDMLIFQFHQCVSITETPTKRSVLSFIARLFDPLGLMAPVITSAKTFLQNLLKITLDWDDPLPQRLADEWRSFREGLNSATTILVPRWIGTRRSERIEVHGFSDASQVVLSAAVYLRVTNVEFETSCSLVIAKTKVAPLNSTTIPRLELSSAVLLVQLVSRTMKILNTPDLPTHLCIDSEIALSWITEDPACWKDFVANRVALIRETAPTAIWHHVPWTDNPADIASCGYIPQLTKDCDLWWTVPSWLKESPSKWPTSTPNPDRGINLEERPAAVHTTTTASPPIWDLLTRYSSLRLLLRVTAGLMESCRAFRRLSDQRHASVILTPIQLDEALQFWVRLTQQAYFSSEFRIVERGGTVPRSSSLSKLTPILEQKDLLSVGGRLSSAEQPFDVKHPLILPRRSELTTLVIDQGHHRTTLHGGTQLTLAFIRQRFWIVGGRAPIRSFIQRCVPCLRQRGIPADQKMGQLPKS